MRLLIAGGGTGGHLFPGVALAEELLSRSKSHDVLFVGTKQGIEARVLPGLGFNLTTIEVSGLKTIGLKGKILGMARLPKSFWQSRRILRDFDPHMVLGVGGYASGPLVMTASLLGFPTGILEQNSVPGMTNRILAKFVRAIFTAFAGCENVLPKKKIIEYGNPIRQKIIDLLKDQSLSGDSVLIVGGSQGALAVNRLVAAAFSYLKESGKTVPKILHQTGKTGFAETQAAYADVGIAADCVEFIDDMASAYAQASVVIARAGATTVAELTICGRPAIFIPYPTAADDHQRQNAKEIVDKGAALMVEQDSTTATELGDLLFDMLSNESKREEMQRAMKSLGRPDAGAKIIDWCLENSSEPSA